MTSLDAPARYAGADSLRATLLACEAVDAGCLPAPRAMELLIAWRQGPGRRGLAFAEFLTATADLPVGALLPAAARVERALASDPRGGAARESGPTGVGNSGTPGAPGGLEDLRLLGQGGMGVVYEGTDPLLGRRVAVKLLRTDDRPEVGSSEPNTLRSASGAPPDLAGPAAAESRARFVREARLTGSMEHPGILPVYGMGFTPAGTPYYTMRLVEGRRTLADAMAAVPMTDLEARLGLLEPFLRVCDAVDYAHTRGVCHRDLKPENVALGPFGEVLVLDWGLAKQRARDGEAPPETVPLDRRVEIPEAVPLETRVGLLGTPGYLSPEAAAGRVDLVDERSDVYGLGVILFEILTGRLPFRPQPMSDYLHDLCTRDAPPLRSVDPIATAGLEAICSGALARERERRPATAGALAMAVRTWQARRLAAAEARGILDRARAALDAAESLRGQDRLRQVDRALETLAGLPAEADARAEADALRERLGRLRESAMREREAASRRKFFVRMAGGALSLAAVAAALVVRALDDRRREAESAVVVARRETRKAEEATGRAEQAERVTKRASVETLSVADAGHARTLARSPWSVDQALQVALRADRRVTDFGGKPAPSVRGALSDAYLAAWQTLTIRLPQNDSIVAARFSPDGRIVAIAPKDGAVRLLRVADGAILTTLSPHEGGATGLAFDSKGRRLATCGEDGAVHVVDVSSGIVERVLRGHVGAVYVVEFSQDGARLLSSGRDGLPRVWRLDAAPDVPPLVLRGHDHSVRGAAFSPLGDRIATASLDGTVRLWDAATGGQTSLLEGHDGGYGQVEFSRDGAYLVASAGRDSFEMGSVRSETPSLTQTPGLWRVSDGRLVAWLAGHGDSARCARFDPSGSRVVTAGDDGTIRVFSTTDGAPVLQMVGHDYMIAALAISPDGGTLLAVDFDRTARLWRLSDGALLRVLDAHEQSILCAEYSSDGSAFLTACVEGVTRIWRGGDPREIPIDAPDRSQCSQVVASPDGASFAAITSSGTVIAIRAADGKPVHRVELANAPATAIAYSADGRLLAVGTTDGSVLLLPTRDWGMPRRLATDVGPVSRAAFDPTGSRLLVVGSSPRACVLDVASGLVLQRIDVGEGRLITGALSRDGKRAILCAVGQRVDVWDVDRGVRLTAALLQDASAGGADDPTESLERTVCVSPSEPLAVVTGGTWQSAVVDVTQGSLRGRLAPDAGTETCADFLPDGRQVAIGNGDGFVRIWDAATGQQVHALRAPGDPKSHGMCRAVRVASGNSTVAVASDEGGLALWDGDTGELLVSLAVPRRDVVSVAITPDASRVACVLRGGGLALFDVSYESLRRRALALEDDLRRAYEPLPERGSEAPVGTASEMEPGDGR